MLYLVQDDALEGQVALYIKSTSPDFTHIAILIYMY